jgi:hypothetical protein
MRVGEWRQWRSSLPFFIPFDVSEFITTAMRSSLVHKLSSRNTSTACRHVPRKVNVVAGAAASTASSSWNIVAGNVATTSLFVGPLVLVSTNSINSRSNAHRLFSSQQGVTTTSSASNQVATSQDNQVLVRPIDFDVQSKVEGNESQIVTVTLKPNQILRAESGGTYSSTVYSLVSLYT